MIKINLLDSVTERQAGTAVVVERKIASPASRLLLMTIAVALLTTLFIGWDVISTQMRKTDALAQLEEQKRIAVEMEAVMKEMKELETKIQNIDNRINAIKKLRETQAGPSAVLEAMRERIAMSPGLYLESVEQTGEQLVVKGNSENEGTVTNFGRSLEFSNGLFSEFIIETQRKEKPNQPKSDAAGPPKQEVVGFTIKCKFKPTKENTPQNPATTASNNGEQPPPTGATTVPDAVRQQLPKQPAAKTNGSM